jgi:hypothetical protein
MCDWVEIQGVDVREVGSQPRMLRQTPSSLAEASPASPDNQAAFGGLAELKSKGMARARLREQDARRNWLLARRARGDLG